MFGDQLSGLRKKHGLKADDIAIIVGVKRRMIFLYENNTAKPSYDVLLNLANFFCVSLDFLTGRSNDPQHDYFYPIAETQLISTLDEHSLHFYKSEKEKLDPECWVHHYIQYRLLTEKIRQHEAAIADLAFPFGRLNSKVSDLVKSPLKYFKDDQKE